MLLTILQHPRQPSTQRVTWPRSHSSEAEQLHTPVCPSVHFGRRREAGRMAEGAGLCKGILEHPLGHKAEPWAQRSEEKT